MKYCTRKWIAYLFTARHREGHGIHSPFLFRLITEVIENKGNFSAWPMLAAAEENVRNTRCTMLYQKRIKRLKVPLQCYQETAFATGKV